MKAVSAAQSGHDPAARGPLERRTVVLMLLGVFRFRRESRHSQFLLGHLCLIHLSPSLASTIDDVPTARGNHRTDNGARNRTQRSTYLFASVGQNVDAESGTSFVVIRRRANPQAGARPDSSADQRIPHAVPFAFGRNPDDTLPSYSLLAGRRTHDNRLVSYAAEVTPTGLGVVLHELNFLARRQLFQPVPVGLILVLIPEGGTRRDSHEEKQEPKTHDTLDLPHPKPPSK